MRQIEHNKSGHDYEGRDSDRELRNQLFKEYIEISHLSEPKNIGDEVYQREEQGSDDYDDSNNDEDFFLTIACCTVIH